jgi:Holliday junction DNA helicase RuvA
MAISNTANVATLTEGIASGDPAYLSKISGVSKKNAEKIVLNLKDKIGTSEAVGSEIQNQNTVAIDALVALGYSERESRDAISKVTTSDNPEKMIKEALKNLNK